jgi:fido (protein-threonine AMPylation protein)
VLTEGTLRDWRYGAIQAERLAAAVLELEGFTNVDPQATLGGADDKKDILARRDGALWLAAVYFPPTDKDFAAIKRKFTGDYGGIARHQADGGFAFFVNKQLTMGERDALSSLSSVPTELYHLERMRHVLDTPRGYGIRLEYLRISMSPEEQFAFLDDQRRLLSEQLTALRHAPGTVPPEALERTMTKLEQTVSALVPRLAPTSIGLPPSWLSQRVASTITSLAGLNVGDLRLLHRELTDAQPWANGGQFRLVNAWIGDEARSTYVPPPPEEVPQRIEAVLASWREAYPALADRGEGQIVEELARLHYGICAVHPFLDANGRLARTVLDLAARDVLSRRISPGLTADRRAYYESLRAANGGELEPLERLIRGSLVDG